MEKIKLEVKGKNNFIYFISYLEGNEKNSINVLFF